MIIQRNFDKMLMLFLSHNFSRIPLSHILAYAGWSGGAMVLGKLPVPGRPTNLDWSRQAPTALAVGAGGCCL